MVTHLIDDYGSGRTRCGTAIKSKNALPFVAAEHAQMHIDGYGMVVCEACLKPAPPGQTEGA